MPSPTNRYVGWFMFLVCSSVSECFTLCMLPCMHLSRFASCLHYFLQTSGWNFAKLCMMIDDVVKCTDNKLIRCLLLRGQGQGPSKVKCFSYCCGRRHTHWHLGVDVSSSRVRNHTWNNILAVITELKEYSQSGENDYYRPVIVLLILRICQAPNNVASYY